MPKDMALPNGPLLKSLRLARGWSQEDLEYETGLTVLRLLELEDAAGRRYGVITRYARARRRRGQPLNISRKTISDAERGGRKYAVTILILAATLGVEPADILPGSPRPPVPAGSTGQPAGPA